MTTTDTDELTERIARALDKNFNPGRYPIMAAMFMDYAAAILPEVEAEVRKAKAEAWEECASEIEKQGTVQIPDNPYEEQE